MKRKMLIKLTDKVKLQK